uniref:Uncharacterized protein n=1 Tax=Anguilla anguilla TaxID=7936 RepID=A0A0E9QNI7_ANGAN
MKLMASARCSNPTFSHWLVLSR